MFPLTGVRVLDLTRGYPGAMVAMFLSDFGAEVIRVDPPPTARRPSDPDPDEAAAYNPFFRNQRSIIVDLTKSEGQEVLYRLVAKADILVDGFRPGVMARLKADYGRLGKINPGLIYCALTGFGSDGPYAAMPGHDMNYIALAGALSLIGPRGGPPYLPSNIIADMAGAGLHGVIGALLALAAREKTGRGQFVDISYVDAVISLLTKESSSYFRSGVAPRRGETMYTGAVPWVNVYQCKDGEYITIAPIEAHLWENLCRAIGTEEFISKQYTTPEENEKIKQEFTRIFLTKTRDEWFAFFKEKNTCMGPVYYLNETFQDPQVKHRNMVVEIDHEKYGKVRQVGLAVKLSDTPGKIRALGARNGAHTREILLEHGYSEEDVAQLHGKGAVASVQ